MKNIFLAFIIASASISFAGNNPKGDYKYESTVVINIVKHSSDDMNYVNSKLVDNSQITREYQCLSSGIIVLKVRHNYMEQGDVRHLILKNLKNKIPTKRIDILFVDMVPASKSNQC